MTRCLALLLLCGCGQGPDADGWYGLDVGRVRVAAGDATPGCLLNGGDYGDDLDPNDAWRSDPQIEKCDAYITLETSGGERLIYSDADGMILEAYEAIDLQLAFPLANTAYFNFYQVTKPGTFVFPLTVGVADRPETWKSYDLRVKAFERPSP